MLATYEHHLVSYLGPDNDPVSDIPQVFISTED